jgi:hypothetical protein
MFFRLYLLHFHRTWRVFCSFHRPHLLCQAYWSSSGRKATATLVSSAPKLLLRSFSLLHLNSITLLVDVVHLLSIVPCLEGPRHLHNACAIARTNSTRRVLTHALRGSRIFQSANDGDEAVRALSHPLAYLPVAVADVDFSQQRSIQTITSPPPPSPTSSHLSAQLLRPPHVPLRLYLFLHR